MCYNCGLSCLNTLENIQNGDKIFIWFVKVPLCTISDGIYCSDKD